MDNTDVRGDRLVRQGKTNKNKNEAIKIRKLIDSIVLINRQEEVIQTLLNGSKNDVKK